MPYVKRAATLHNLWRNPYRTQADVQEFQRIRLEEIVSHSYRHVPCYREKLRESGIKPETFQAGVEIDSLPLTTKMELKKTAWNRKTDERIDPEKLLGNRTSGSTGIPFEMRRTPWEDFLFHFLRWRIVKHYGLVGSDRMLRIAREVREPMPASWRWLQSLGRFRRKKIGIALQPEEIAAILEEEKPDVISGYAGVLFLTAKVLIENTVHDVLPKFVVTGAETLNPKMRERINQAFSAPVYDTYESLEVGPLAWECPVSGLYHVNDDNIFLEVLRDGVPAQEGESGEVVVTGLHMFAMPFIRYPLNDIVTVGPKRCPCGHPFSTLASLEGRKNDFMLMPSGKKVHAGLFVHELNLFIPRTEQYELVQERHNRIYMNVICSPPVTPEERQSLLTKIRARLENGVEFEIKNVDRIELSPGMKFRIKRSQVDSFYDD
jgi:phenylacetate-CoA ligase